MKSLRTFAAATALTFIGVSNVSAQSTAAARSGMARANLISANPIGLLFEWYNGEFEHAVAPTASLAVSASSFDFGGDTQYTAIDGIARFYPSGHALRGFSVGASLGFIALKDERNCFDCSSDTESTGTVGVRADYVWILGRDQHFSAEMGIGAKRLISAKLDTDGVPIGRLSIGYAW